MNLEQQIKKVIILAEKNGLLDAAEFIRGFIRKQEVILKKKLKEAKRA
ncbi:MAG: hypothetical protein ABFD50_20890 [Smithella sp.]|jgi:hypothetical protein